MAGRKSPSPTEPAPAKAAEAKPAPKPVEPTPAPRPKPRIPTPSNPVLDKMRELSRKELLDEIRRVTGNNDAVLWEQIGYGDVYEVIVADARTAKALGTRIGEVIAYTTQGGPMGSATGGLTLTPQDVSPYGDPFIP
jgi:hypothetical protein